MKFVILGTVEGLLEVGLVTRKGHVLTVKVNMAVLNNGIRC